MTRIGLISDTHGFLHPRIISFFKECNEIWHAGDIGSPKVSEQLERLKPLRAVYGNIDDTELRKRFPETQLFTIESVRVLMMHIGGYPGRYTAQARALIKEHAPTLFISGHSHILKVQYDPKFKLLHINPGAAGNSGFHKSITAVRFVINGDRINDLEVFETDRKSKRFY